MRDLTIAGLATVFLATTLAFTAQTPAQARTAQSIECSKQADAKGLHGKERKAFRSHCLHDMKAGKA
jgi:psiF repeat